MGRPWSADDEHIFEAPRTRPPSPAPPPAPPRAAPARPPVPPKDRPTLRSYAAAPVPKGGGDDDHGFEVRKASDLMKTQMPQFWSQIPMTSSPAALISRRPEERPGMTTIAQPPPAAAASPPADMWSAWPSAPTDAGDQTALDTGCPSALDAAALDDGGPVALAHKQAGDVGGGPAASSLPNQPATIQRSRSAARRRLQTPAPPTPSTPMGRSARTICLKRRSRRRPAKGLGMLGSNTRASRGAAIPAAGGLRLSAAAPLARSESARWPGPSPARRRDAFRRKVLRPPKNGKRTQRHWCDLES